MQFLVVFLFLPWEMPVISEIDDSIQEGCSGEGGRTGVGLDVGEEEQLGGLAGKLGGPRLDPLGALSKP